MRPTSVWRWLRGTSRWTEYNSIIDLAKWRGYVVTSLLDTFRRLKMLHYYLGVLDSIDIDLPKRTHRMLDVGCGPGFDTACWAQFDMAAIGIDLSPQGVSKGHQNWSDYAAFVIAGARELCCPHCAFDLIFVKGCTLINTPDLAKFRAVAARYLDFLVSRGVLLWIAHTNFSGIAPTGWLNHTSAELEHMFAGLDASNLSI